MDVENGDYEHSAVMEGEVVGCADVGWRDGEESVGVFGGETYSLMQEDFGG